jgi:hypothetical protein
MPSRNDKPPDLIQTRFSAPDGVCVAQRQQRSTWVTPGGFLIENTREAFSKANVYRLSRVVKPRFACLLVNLRPTEQKARITF